jgi:hypothetical protein
MEKFPPGTYHWVHTEQFIRNDFGAYGKPTVVILPQTEALGDEEAQALRKYVEDGGFLVADRNPGIRDAHGRRRAKGALDDLFAPGAPKPVGKGKTLLLNALPQDADFDRIMAFAGLAPDWRVEQGTTPIVMMTRDYRRGEHLYFGCTGNSALDAAALKNTQAAIVLAEPMHCYDSRRGTYLGETDRIPVRFESPNWMGNVFACLPYRVEGITIEGLKPQYAPGDVVSFAARMAPAAAQKQVHTLRLQVLNQAGREVNVYADRIETANGVARGEIPLAFNDRAGAWKVAVTDVASGVRSESPFLVKE